MARNIVIIGSGVGGCAVAALLAKAGYQVTLLEAHSFPGGRCAAMEKQGYYFDFGVHMFSRGNKGPHGEVNRKIDGNLRWINMNPACRVMGMAEFDFPLDIRPIGHQITIARKLELSQRTIGGHFV